MPRFPRRVAPYCTTYAPGSEDIDRLVQITTRQLRARNRCAFCSESSGDSRRFPNSLPVPTPGYPDPRKMRASGYRFETVGSLLRLTQLCPVADIPIHRARISAPDLSPCKLRRIYEDVGDGRAVLQRPSPHHGSDAIEKIGHMRDQYSSVDVLPVGKRLAMRDR
jgi:hypothetical protein